MKKIILIFVLFSFAGGLKAQLNLVGEFIRGGVHDGELLAKAYLKPYEISLGYSAVDSRTIYFNKKNDDAFHFGLGLKVNSIFVPEEDYSFDVSTLGLEHMEAADPKHTMAQTIFGDTTHIAMRSTDTYQPPFSQELPLTTFNTPDGTGFHFLPIPDLQLGAYYKNVYAVASGYVVPYKNVTVFGYNITLGSQVTSFFELTKDFPVQAEVEAGFGGSSQTVKLEVKPDAKVELLAKGPYDNQEFTLNLSGYNIGVGANYRFWKLIFYAKGYYQHFSSRTRLTGNYPVNVKDPTGTLGINVQDVTDPIDYTRAYSGMKFTAGLQFDFSFFYLKSDYSFSRYNSFSVSFGVLL